MTLQSDSPPSAQLERLEKTFQKQLLKREARKHLIPFTEYTYDRYKTGRHHRIIAEQLERVERREIDRLMLLLPPRHGKTELASRRYPAWCLGRNPTRQIIAASAGKEFAGDVGREVRNTIRSQEYQEIFPDLLLAEDSQAAGRWHTKQGGVFHAVGVDSQVIGKGADEFIIDDPFGTMADAQSPVERKRVHEWYQGSVYNRLQPGGAIVIIGHRMHEDDLQGFVLAQAANGGDKWEVVELPAIDGAGQALWPDAYPVEALQRIRRNMLSRFWSALYQQNPQPDEGTFFKREWFKRHTEVPKVNVYGASDLAVTEGGGDFTSHGVWGVGIDAETKAPMLYAMDWWRGQTDASEWIERKLDLVKTHKPFAWFDEDGVIRKATEGVTKRRMDERKVWVSQEWLPSIHDKPTRARAFQAMAANGRVSFPKTEWADHVIDQLIRFPTGKYDDDVDVCSLIGRAVYDLHPAIVSPEARPNKPNDRYSRNRSITESYRTA